MKSLISKAKTFTSFSWQEKKIICQALILIPLVALSVQIWGLRYTQMNLAKLSSQEMLMQPLEPLSLAIKTAGMVGIAIRYSPLTNCLRKSLVLWFLLRCQGIHTQLRIGVRQKEGEFQSHAWVEYQSIVLNDHQNISQVYTAFDRPIESFM